MVAHAIKRKLVFNKQVLACKPGEVVFFKGQLVQIYRSDLDYTFKTNWKLIPKWSTPHISKTPCYFLILVVYLIILGAIQADSRESPRTIQVDYTLVDCYLYKWDFLVQARSANFLLTFQPFSGLISGQYPEKKTQVSSSNIAKYSQQESNNYISKMAFKFLLH